MGLPQIDTFLAKLGAIAGVATLAIALVAVFWSIRQAPAREEPGGRIFLRGPALLLGSSIFIALAAILWRPLPLAIPSAAGAVAAMAGALLLLVGSALYLWGLFSLRGMFAPSSGFAVRIQASDRLVTSGPYAYVRHPMYLAVIIAAVGSLFLYRTWTTLLFSVAMLGLVIRARREERVLASEFTTEWEAYASRVPMWLPGVSTANRSGA